MHDESRNSLTPPLEWIAGEYAICRLKPDQPLPEWVRGCIDERRTHAERSATHDAERRATDSGTPLFSVTWTERECSIIAPTDAVPDEAEAERGFIAFRVAGVLDFCLVGVLSKLTTALAEAEIPVFAVSTFETDYLLIRKENLTRANEVLQFK